MKPQLDPITSTSLRLDDIPCQECGGPSTIVLIYDELELSATEGGTVTGRYEGYCAEHEPPTMGTHVEAPE